MLPFFEANPFCLLSVVLVYFYFFPIICLSNILEHQGIQLVFTEYPRGGTVVVLLICRV